MILVLTDDTDINGHLCSDRIEYNDINTISVNSFLKKILKAIILVPLNKVFNENIQ